jgi:cysteinyl-tRNA synthetase
MLQSHYSSTLDFSNDALKAAQKGYKKLINSLRLVREMNFEQEGHLDENLDKAIIASCEACDYSMNDDFNTAKTIAQLFNISKRINAIHNGNLPLGSMSGSTFNRMKSTYIEFVENVLGLMEEKVEDPGFMLNTLISIYKDAKFRKAYDQVDAIRSSLRSGGIILKDMKTDVDWAYEE